MEGIKFDEKLGLQELVLKGKKTMFRIPARKSDKIFSKYHVGQELAILQAYRDIDIDPEQPVFEKNSDGVLEQMCAVESKGWTRKSSVDPELMPHRIVITGVSKENIRDISSEDCEKEGITPVADDIATLDGNIGFAGFSIDGKIWLGDTPQEAFAAISNSAVKKGAWNSGIKVEVYTFKLK